MYQLRNTRFFINNQRKENKMDKEDVLNVFRELAQSQGFYGRILRDIGWNGENVDDSFWEQFKDCTTDVDVVLVMEQ
jgi:hypothetical protein